jgi:hypothetical protein
MGRPDTAGVRHAILLGRAVQHAWDDTNTALRNLGAEPAAPLRRRYGLRLATLEISVRGYCVTRPFGWERAPEVVLSTGRPPLWRRLLRPAPLLVLTLQAGPGGVLGTIAAAPDGAGARRGGYIVRLEPAMQRQLAEAHAGRRNAHGKPQSKPQSNTYSVARRLSGWVARFF